MPGQGYYRVLENSLYSELLPSSNDVLITTVMLCMDNLDQLLKKTFVTSCELGNKFICLYLCQRNQIKPDQNP